MRVVIASVTALVAACGPSSKSGGCKDKLLPGDLVLTEVFADFKAPVGGSGVDTGKEWFEVYNASDRPVSLEGLTITHSRPDGSKAATHTMLEATVAPGQFFTLGNAAQEFVPAYVDYGYGADLGDLFNADGGKLALSCGDSEIDSAVYDSVKEGHSRELTAAQPPDYTLNDDQGSWCQANDSEFEVGNFGTPGSDNDCEPIVVGQCNDNGTLRDSVAPAVGDLVITEVMPSPAKVSDTTGEWFEAKVINDVDLNGVGLDRIGDTAKPDLISSPDCVRVTAGSYLVFAKSVDSVMNGGLPTPIAGTFKFAMVSGSAAAPGDVAIVAGTTVIDAVSWTKSSSGKSLQLDPDLTDPVANDSESNFCDGQVAYGAGDLGTPALANSQCNSLPPPGMCDAGGTLRPIVKPAAGALVITEFLANPANVTGFTDAQREWFEVTNTGAAAFDLNELGLGRVGQTATPIQSAKCISIAAGSFGLLARSSDPAVNGMLPPVDATFGFGLVDTNGDIQISDGAVVLDAVTWTSVTSGVTKQLNPTQLTTTGNDTAANFCPGTTAYGDGTNKGTPKAANAPCP